ncbi:ferritin-like domain-containing protein [Mesonia sp. K7]|uniref:ferritin-like domain-containing protein n=1 Tax=Mesonia sp. K7 TaxID=2218606 RepID=UPI000DA837B3|nr:ferritin-like domain-containing protein [Mesonia sp. K7]PZD78998.1 ferritin-like domain-containing protein [Mesonia sp. K7]
MSIIKFLDEFTNDNIEGKLASRKDALNKITRIGKKAAMASIPLGLAGMVSQKSKAAVFQSNDQVVATLQLALVLEYLEASFYNQALDSGVLTNPKATAIYEQIAKHENAHVTLLKDVINSLGETPGAEPTFDFTAGGAFDPFNENGAGQETAYAQLLALAQAFEDTGVRAYKGQAGNLMGNDQLLTAALQIHSVEARHASEIRRLRGLEGWITLNQRGIGMPAAAQPVYDGATPESNTIQGGVDVTTLGNGNPFTAEASSQAYDEVLTGDEAVAIASLFIE